MNRPRLKPEEERLLLDIVKRRDPSLLPLVQRASHNLINADQREALTQVLVAEFVEKGLRPDDEPTKYGLAVDDLIGALVQERH